MVSMKPMVHFDVRGMEMHMNIKVEIANENCCWCRGTGSPTTLVLTTRFPAIVLVPTPHPTTTGTTR